MAARSSTLSPGLWCVNAGHGRREITEAVSSQLETMDFAPSFQMGHPAAFELANRLVEITPAGLDHVFFTNSGSGVGRHGAQDRTCLPSRPGRGDSHATHRAESGGYHGVGFGRHFCRWHSVQPQDVVQLTAAECRSPCSHPRPGKKRVLTRRAGSRHASGGRTGEARHAARRLDNSCSHHRADCGSTGVLIPPRGYLKRIREICDRHGISADFRRSDHRIRAHRSTLRLAGARCHSGHPDNGQGSHQRLHPHGEPSSPANQCTKRSCRDPRTPLSCSTATRIRLIQQPAQRDLPPSASMSGRGSSPVRRPWRVPGKMRAHSLRELPHVVDIRNYGLMLGLELESVPGKPGTRAFDVYSKCFEKGLLTRQTADIIALSPPLIVEPAADRPDIHDAR